MWLLLILVAAPEVDPQEGAAPTWYALARSYYESGDRHRAFQAADDGFSRFPGERDLERLRVMLLLELGLSQEGLASARRFLQHPRTLVTEYLKLAAILGANRDLPHAAELLEEALLRYPFNAEVRKQLARVYFESERPLTAARVLHPVALEQPSQALLAAELYRRAGKIDQALRMNALVLDQRDKIRQRLDLLIEAERYAEVAALDERLSRLGLLREERLLYALAYAHYVSGERERVQQLLGRVSEGEFLSKAAAIQEAMATCDEDVWQCD
jgi:predicted Zn-dependent protease